MSNALAIAAVTATLKDLMQTALSAAGLDTLGDIEVTTRPVDAAVEGNEANRLNIYPWKVVPNPAFVADRTPARDANAARLNNPRLALDLYYVITADGAADLQAELLLGVAMQLLHEHPHLTPSDIEAALNPPVASNGSAPRSAAMRVLERQDLSQQIERVRITPIPAHDEDLGRVWPAFSAPLRMAAFYKVALVLIEEQVSLDPGPPVRHPVVELSQLRQPHIARVLAQSPGAAGDADPTASIFAGQWLRILGNGLWSDAVQVILADRALAPVVQRTDGLSVEIPASQAAGRHSLRVVHRHNGVALEQSNTVDCHVTPQIVAQVVSGREVSAMIAGADRAAITGILSLTLTAPVPKEAVVRVSLVPEVDNADLPVQALRREDADGDAQDMRFALSAVAKGRYRFRLSVDGVSGAEIPIMIEVP